MKSSKVELIEELQKRVEDRILEPTNFKLLKKLIERADTLDEAIDIASLGTMYKKTGFHFDVRLPKPKPSDTIKYFKKNEKLSFVTDSKKKTHKLIIGDNYPALLNLLIEYKGAIDVIYIDPPYGKDSMGEFAQTNYENAITRDNLLSMLYPRLLIAKMLLSEEGILFCSIDEKNQAYLKCMFDEIFAEKNTDCLVWQKMDAQVDRNTNAKIIHRFKGIHESILIAYGNKEITRFAKMMKLPEWKNTYTNPDNDPRGAYKQGIISFTEGHEKEDKTSPNYYSIKTPSGKTITRLFYFSKKEYEEYEADNRIYYPANGDGIPALKIFENEEKEYYMDSILRGVGTTSTAKDEIFSIFNDREIFDTPKPTKLIKELLRVSTREKSLVLDFFAGSGTVGQATIELNEDGKNRQFILVTNNEITDKTPNGIAYDVTTKRLKRVMTGECYDGTKDFKWLESNSPLGDNLDVYEIAEVANFEATEGKTPFDVIDETLYGVEKFATIQEKVEWVCDNFEITQKKLEEN